MCPTRDFRCKALTRTISRVDECKLGLFELICQMEMFGNDGCVAAFAYWQRCVFFEYAAVQD